MSRTLLVLAFVVANTTAFAQHVKVVGIGASSCARFVEDVQKTPRVERDYFAWAQGFMSAVLLNAPKGRDEGLDLTPESFPLQKQAVHLHEFCAQHLDRNYADGVVDLYLTLRKAGEVPGAASR